jgi:hypothetical protein
MSAWDVILALMWQGNAQWQSLEGNKRFKKIHQQIYGVRYDINNNGSSYNIIPSEQMLRNKRWSM